MAPLAYAGGGRTARNPQTKELHTMSRDGNVTSGFPRGRFRAWTGAWPNHAADVMQLGMEKVKRT